MPPLPPTMSYMFPLIYCLNVTIPISNGNNGADSEIYKKSGFLSLEE